MHEEFFSGVADADTLRFCIEDDGDGFVLVAGLVDVDVYVASSGFNDRHFGVLHDGLNKARSPSWNEQVDVTLGLHHGGGAWRPYSSTDAMSAGSYPYSRSTSAMMPSMAALVRSARVRL